MTRLSILFGITILSSAFHQLWNGINSTLFPQLSLAACVPCPMHICQCDQDPPDASLASLLSGNRELELPFVGNCEIQITNLLFRLRWVGNLHPWLACGEYSVPGRLDKSF